MPKLYLRVLSAAEPIATSEEILEGYDIRVQWLITENDGSVRGFGETDQRGLQDVADPNVDWLNDPANTTVFVPSQFVLSVGCQVPGRSTTQIRRALPFAVEEYVAADIETMHIAHGPIRAGEQVLCNLVANDAMDNWLGCFAAAGVNPGQMITDAELIPRESGSASLAFLDAEVLIVHGDEAALVDRATLGFALGSLEVERLHCVGGEPSDMELGQMQNAVTVEAVPFSEAGFIQYLADQSRGGSRAAINLMQGVYRAQRQISKGAARWRSVAALAAGWLLVAFIGMAVHGFWASSEADRLEAEVFAFYKEIFPRESQPRTVDQLRRFVAAKLGRKLDSGEASAFIGLTANVAQVLTENNLVTSMSYTEQRRELSLEVLMETYDEIDALKAKLAESGIDLETTTAQATDEGIKSQLRVKYR
ncbi:MAG: type II secretion system protein GspL [Pseudomonadota bacterium]